MILLWPGEKEPRYNGLPLHDLVENLAQPRKWQDYGHPGEAIQQIGTNALPFLLKWVAHEEKRYGAEKLADYLVGKTPRGWCRDTLHHCAEFRDLRAQGAECAFEVFGARAASAIPALHKLARSRSPEVARRATRCLADVGRQSIPALASIAADTNADPTARACAMVEIVSYGTSTGRPVLRTLVGLTGDREADVAVWAIRFVGWAGIYEPEVAVPALTRALEDARPTVRTEATNALRILFRYGLTNSVETGPQG